VAGRGIRAERMLCEMRAAAAVTTIASIDMHGVERCCGCAFVDNVRPFSRVEYLH
jgi:hypothetical protein